MWVLVIVDETVDVAVVDTVVRSQPLNVSRITSEIALLRTLADSKQSVRSIKLPLASQTMSFGTSNAGER